jgi:SNF2 family DNA or RNA helicase
MAKLISKRMMEDVSFTAYDIEVADNHNYFAEDILVHNCKNPASQQGKGILKIQPECRIAMTGTPLMNTPFDLYIILKWLGYEGHSFSAFKNHYALYGGFGGYEVVGYRYLDELQKQLDKIMLRRLKKDVLDLPEKTHIDEYVEMTPKQAQIYREISSEIRMNIDQIKMANNPLAELIRMRQATGYTGILSSTIKESAKLDRMEELVEEAVENGKKVVIFSNWTQMTLPIYNRLAVKYRGAYITGEVDSDQRQAHVKQFQEDDNCKFIVGTIGAMGTGLTLTAGTVEIFMDEPWNRANKEQAEDRCHRVGTTENITIYTILCKNTIDERIHELVERKGQMADALVDGKIQIDKGAMLDFLLS